FNIKINELYNTIDDRYFQEGNNINQFLIDSHNFYKLLFSDLEKYLPHEGKLIFTIDSYLKNIPISTLYDGNQYLVEKYSIVMTLGGKIPKSKPLSKNNLRVLFGGLVSENHSSFKEDKIRNLRLKWKALSYVEYENKFVKRYTKYVVELLEKNFTQRNFKNKLVLSDFPIVHVATHGYFSSNPENTFIAASDELLELQEIEQLIRLRHDGTYNSINLLVLSACETAKSDRIGNLGMAGIATQAGAKSTLATLWKVQDDSTADLIGEFYKALSREKTDKAESLRQAQISLIHSEKYNHPYYWGAFVFAGNWL
ncbi:MAG: CHAT domain-containing protein, partial [Cyanobacteria bacterium P01_A01_bin.80]